MERHGLSAEQIAWRRTRWQLMRGQAGQEYAEDAVSCFLASGECVFDMEAIEQQLQRLMEESRWSRRTTGG